MVRGRTALAGVWLRAEESAISNYRLGQTVQNVEM